MAQEGHDKGREGLKGLWDTRKILLEAIVIPKRHAPKGKGEKENDR